MARGWCREGVSLHEIRKTPRRLRFRPYHDGQHLPTRPKLDRGREGRHYPLARALHAFRHMHRVLAEEFLDKNVIEVLPPGAGSDVLLRFPPAGVEVPLLGRDVR